MGKLEDAVEVDIVTCTEPWTQYQLADGKILMFKDVVVGVYKLSSIKNKDGTAIYQFTTHRIVKIK